MTCAPSGPNRIFIIYRGSGICRGYVIYSASCCLVFVLVEYFLIMVLLFFLANAYDDSDILLGLEPFWADLLLGLEPFWAN